MTTEKPSIEAVRALEAFIAGDGRPEHLLTFQGILRSHEEMRQALSYVRTEVDGTEWTDASWRHQREAVGRILSTIERGIPTGEVRLRGTVTDEADVPGGCIYCSSSGVIKDFEGERPCSNCDGTGTPRLRGTVTDAERAAINGALIEVLPIWTSEIETEYARSALLRAIVPALEAAWGARVSAENTTPTNHTIRSEGAGNAE